MNREESMFGAEPDRLRQLIRSGMDIDEMDVDENPPAGPPVGRVMERPGTQIGCYKLLRILGEGGMGVVYLAEQEQLIRRRVALKIIKPGMDSKRVLARFEAERQALALLDHPNIAQVHDAGTADSGRPYFVMEYVKGIPITDFCDRHSLSIEQRLRLFQQVCGALHHAHQKGIIHRDVKPSNILVTSENDQSAPKIIDFGVAKAIIQPLTERTLVTENSQLLGTPEYMSPEQVEFANEDIDTRSDIYSLGVLLYELLTGVLPFDSDTLRGGIENIRKAIRETDPKTPSTRLTKLGDEANVIAHNRGMQVHVLARHLRSELEWIPLKAMRKERAERYRSASELADDVENYLKGEPLIAGPPGTRYRLKKFVRRNRALVGGIAAVLVVLVAGVAVSTVFAIGQARARADAELVTDFLERGVLNSGRDFKGREATLIDTLNSATTMLDRGDFQKRPLVEATIRQKLQRTYYDLGYFARAAGHQKPILRIYTEQFGKHHWKTGRALNWLAVCYYHAGMYREAEPLYKEVIEQARRHRAGFMVDYKLTWNANLGTTCAGLGRYREAEQLVRPKVEADSNLGYGVHLGEIYRELGEYEAADRVLVEALDALRKPYEGPNMVGRAKGRVRCIHQLALLRLVQGHDKEAEELFQQGIDVGDRELPGKDHPSMLRNVNGLALIRIKQQRYDEAKILLDRALIGRKLKLGEHHPDTIKTIHDFGILHREQGHFEEAEKRLTEALSARRIKLGPDHPHTLESMHELAVLYIAQNDYEKAAPLLVETYNGREAKLGPEHPHTVESLRELIRLHESWNKPDEAAKWRAKLAEMKTTEE